MMGRLRLALIAVAALTAMRPAAAQSPGSTAPVQDFEAPFAIEKWPPDSPNQIEFSDAWQARGRQSLQLGGGVMAALTEMQTRNWRGYTALRLVVNNPTGRTVRVGFELQDHNPTYHERHQSAFGVEPGVQVVELDIAGPLWRGEENRPYRGQVKAPIDVGRITRVSFYNHGDGPIYLDALEVVAAEALETPGGWAFDFGPALAPRTRHWTPVGPEAQPSPRRRYGFVETGAQALEQFMSFPTPALGDGVAWPPAGFAVDLAGGPYLGWIAFERGGFWEDQNAAYTRATLTCNGQPVHEHAFSAAGSDFLFEDVELTDMDQVADRLVWPAHAVARFRLEAVRGTNVLRLQVKGSRGLPLRVAALILVPDTRAGGEYLKGLVDEQRRLVRRTFAPLDRGRRGPERQAPARDLVVEVLPPGATVYPRDWPSTPEGKLPEEMIAVAGQRVTVQLAVYARRAQQLTVRAAAPAGPSRLPAPEVSCGRYLPMRPYGTGVAWLEVNHYRPETEFGVGPDLTRALVVEYAVPPDARPGQYRGAIALGGEGSRTEVPVHLRVLAVPLPDIPIPVGLFMNALPMGPQDLDEKTWWRLQGSLLREQVGAGLNCLTGGPGLRFEVATTGGAAAVRGEAAVRYLHLAQEQGPIRAVVPYGGFLPHLRTLTGDPAALAAALRALEEKEGLPPQYVYAYDEPGTAAELERTLQYLSRTRDSGLRTIGYTSWHADEPRWREMVEATWAPALNGHDGESLQELAREGKEPWVYNNGLDRVGMGLRIWRSLQLGAAGRLQWIGLFTQGFAFDNLDGREPSVSCFLVHDRLGVLKTPEWLAAREGLLDLRLRLALEAAAPAGDPARDLWTVEGYRQDEAAWTDARLDEVRRQMLERLAELVETR